jgi:Mn2+/Fe2+ NRAMP family transporter
MLLTLDSFNRLAQVFKILCLALFSYIIVAVIVTHHWLSVLDNTVVPHITFFKSYMAIFVAILGTTISPYLFFWQSAHRIEDMKDEDEGGDGVRTLQQRVRSRAQLKERMSRLDVFSGMAFSNVVMFAIIATAGETLHVHHKTSISSAAQAAQALQPLAGKGASIIFALGFIGSGLLAVPVLAASGSIGLSDLMGKKWGFSSSIKKAPLFYALVGVGTLGGTALSLLHINPIQLLIFVAVVNGVVAAPFLFVVLRIAGSHSIMGEFVNGKLSRTLGWITFAVMAGASVLLFATL